MRHVAHHIIDAVVNRVGVDWDAINALQGIRGTESTMGRMWTFSKEIEVFPMPPRGNQSCQSNTPEPEGTYIEIDDVVTISLVNDTQTSTEHISGE